MLNECPRNNHVADKRFDAVAVKIIAFRDVIWCNVGQVHSQGWGEGGVQVDAMRPLQVWMHPLRIFRILQKNMLNSLLT